MHNVASVESSIYSNYIDRVLGLLVFKGEGTSEVTVLNVSLLVFTAPSESEQEDADWEGAKPSPPPQRVFLRIRRWSSSSLSFDQSKQVYGTPGISGGHPVVS